MHNNTQDVLEQINCSKAEQKKITNLEIQYNMTKGTGSRDGLVFELHK